MSKNVEKGGAGGVFCAKFNFLRVDFKCWSTITGDDSFE